jgi:hypothetical protein
MYECVLQCAMAQHASLFLAQQAYRRTATHCMRAHRLLHLLTSRAVRAAALVAAQFSMLLLHDIDSGALHLDVSVVAIVSSASERLQQQQQQHTASVAIEVALIVCSSVQEANSLRGTGRTRGYLAVEGTTDT